MSAEETSVGTPSTEETSAAFVPPSEPVVQVVPDIPTPQQEAAVEMEDVEKIVPLGEEFPLSTGLIVKIESLKTKQFFILLRIITHGAPQLIGSIKLDADLDPKEFTSRLATLVLLSLPESGDQAIEFLQSMVTPVGLKDDQSDGPIWEEYFEAMVNPELEDTITIMQAVIEREGPDLLALGKRLLRMFNVAAKAGVTKSLDSPAT